jgi:dihydrofolate reductase
MPDLCGYKALMGHIGIIIMGSSSYKQILTFGEWTWPDKQTYVFTSQKLITEMPCIEFVKDKPKAFLKKLKSTGINKDIWLLGGASLAHSFAEENLIDEIVLTLIPIHLVKGIPLTLPLADYTLSLEKPCMDGIVQKIYLRKEL